MAESLVPALERLGSLTTDSNLGCRICQDSGITLGGDELDEVHFEILEARISEFGLRRYQITEPIASEDWSEALLRFFAGKEDPSGKVVKLDDELLPNAHSRDNWLVSRFILEEKKLNSDVFEVIKRVFVGYAIADAVSTIQTTGHPEHWSDLVVAYDTPILMRLLGTSGSLMRTATLEMHALLQNLGCNTVYFRNVASELFGNLDQISENLQTGKRVHPETRQALETREISAAEVNLMKGDADRRLSELGVFEKDLPSARLHNAIGQIDALDLERYLRGKINYRRTSVEPSSVDAESVENILFLRRGNRHRSLPKTKYIFVTHNYPFASASSEYCRSRCSYTSQDVPPVVTINTLSRMGWIASDYSDEAYEISSELIANCYSASLPDEQWTQKFWDAIENTSPALLDVDAHESLYLSAVREIAEEKSLGSGALFNRVDIPSILESVKKNAEAREEEHMRDKLRVVLEADLEKEELEATHRDSVRETLISMKDVYARRADSEAERRENERVEEIRSNFTKAADHHSKVVAKIISIAISLLMVYFFILYAGSPSDLANASAIQKIAAVIILVLTAVQIVGLFVESSNFLFVGRYFRKKYTPKATIILYEAYRQRIAGRRSALICIYVLRITLRCSGQLRPARNPRVPQNAHRPQLPLKRFVEHTRWRGRKPSLDRQVVNTL